MIDEVCALKNEFGEEVKNFLAEKKETLVGEKQAEYDERKEKWKKLPKAERTGTFTQATQWSLLTPTKST